MSVSKGSSVSLSAKDDDSEEARERKRLEKRLREKELAYRERLKAWEAREEKRRVEYDAERKKEQARIKAAQKEARKLRQFLEDYDDRRDDQVHFKGAQLERRLKLREKEIEGDNKDRVREREELEELKKRLAEKGLHEDVEAEAKRVCTLMTKKICFDIHSFICVLLLHRFKMMKTRE
jgi:RNA-binding protein 25